MNKCICAPFLAFPSPTPSPESRTAGGLNKRPSAGASNWAWSSNLASSLGGKKRISKRGNRAEGHRCKERLSFSLRPEREAHHYLSNWKPKSHSSLETSPLDPLSIGCHICPLALLSVASSRTAANRHSNTSIHSSCLCCSLLLLFVSRSLGQGNERRSSFTALRCTIGLERASSIECSLNEFLEVLVETVGREDGWQAGRTCGTFNAMLQGRARPCKLLACGLLAGSPRPACPSVWPSGH